jgi:hypothetical protein
MAFFAFKYLVRGIVFGKSPRLVPEPKFGISIPRRIFLTKNQDFGWSELSTLNVLQNVVGYFSASFLSIYQIYKVAKMYKFIKYTISFSRIVSRFTGFLCSLWLPRPFRYLLYGAYCKAYGIDMSEVAEEDLGEYKTFTEFFTRRLKPEARKIFEP